MKNGNILIVDDRIDLIEPLAEILERRGHNVTMVEDGDKALWLVKSRNFDILITPFELPGVSGRCDFKVLKRLCPSMAVIMVNSVKKKKEITEILESEVEAVVDKPFNVKRLVDTVESILEGPLILIVDYRLEDREALKNMLAERRYRVLVAKNGDEGIEMMRETDFDLVLAGMGVAGMEGMQILQMVKKIKPNTEVVMMIEYSSLRLVADLLKKGAYTCVYKPFLDKEKLVKVIEEVQSKERSYASSVDSEFSRS